MAGDSHGTKFYLKIYFILLLLFVISVIGPEIGIRWLTLVTAFGIALVKAYMVAAYFMHLNVEKRYIWYMLGAMLVAVGMFFAGVSPDVMEKSGQNWVNQGAQHQIEKHAEALEELNSGGTTEEH